MSYSRGGDYEHGNQDRGSRNGGGGYDRKRGEGDYNRDGGGGYPNRGGDGGSFNRSYGGAAAVYNDSYNNRNDAGADFSDGQSAFSSSSGGTRLRTRETGVNPRGIGLAAKMFYEEPKLVAPATPKKKVLEFGVRPQETAVDGNKSNTAATQPMKPSFVEDIQHQPRNVVQHDNAFNDAVEAAKSSLSSSGGMAPPPNSGYGISNGVVDGTFKSYGASLPPLADNGHVQNQQSFKYQHMEYNGIDDGYHQQQQPYRNHQHEIAPPIEQQLPFVVQHQQQSRQHQISIDELNDLNDIIAEFKHAFTKLNAFMQNFDHS